MLENSSYPFATKILEAIKRNEEAMAAGQAPQGIPTELLAQLQGEQLGEGGQSGIRQPALSEQQSEQPALSSASVNGVGESESLYNGRK
jgi:hypothetical protein